MTCLVFHSILNELDNVEANEQLSCKMEGERREGRGRGRGRRGRGGRWERKGGRERKEGEGREVGKHE